MYNVGEDNSSVLGI